MRYRSRLTGMGGIRKRVWASSPPDAQEVVRRHSSFRVYSTASGAGRNARANARLAIATPVNPCRGAATGGWESMTFNGNHPPTDKRPRVLCSENRRKMQSDGRELADRSTLS